MPDLEDYLDPLPSSRRVRPTSPHLKELTDFAKENSLTVGSTTGGRHNKNSLHYSGNAIDIKGSGGFDDAKVGQLTRLASQRGLKLRDERVRPKGQQVWHGAHVHLEFAGDQPGSVENYLDPQTPAKPAKSSVEDYLDPVETVASKAQPSAEQALLNIMGEVNEKTARMERQARRPVTDSRADLERPLYESQRGQPATSNLSSDELRVTKGEQPSDRLAYQRAGDLASRRPETPQQVFETERPSIRPLTRAERFKQRAAELANKLPGVAALDTPEGISTDFPRGLASGATLGAVGSAPGSNEQILPGITRHGLGETVGALAPLMATGAVLPTTLSPAVRTAATFGITGAGRQAVNAAEGRPVDVTAPLEEAALGLVMGRLEGLDPTMKRRIVAYVMPGIGLDIAKGASAKEAVQRAGTNLAFAVTAGGKPKGEGNARATERNIRGDKSVDRAGQSRSESLANSDTAPQRYQHLQFGEIEVLPDQSGANRGKLKVAEVSDPSKIHYVKKSDMQGRGNARMIPIKETPAEAPQVPATASPEVPLNEGVQSPSTPAERVAYLEQKLEDMGAADATLENTPPERLAAITDVRKDLEKLRAENPSIVESYTVKDSKGNIIGQGLSDADLGEVMRETPAGQRIEIENKGWTGRPMRFGWTQPESPSVREGEKPESITAYHATYEQPSSDKVASPATLTTEKSLAPETKSESRKETTNEPVEAPLSAKPTAETSTREGSGPASSEPSSTAAKREKVTSDRAARGEEPIPKPERKPDEQLLADAKTANEKDPNEPLRIVDQVLNGKKGAMSDTETVQIDLHVQELKNKYDAVNEGLANAKDSETIRDLTEKSDAMEREMRASEEAWAQSGTEKGRSLRAQRFEIDNDFRPLTMIAKRIKAKGDKPLTTEERELIKTQAQQIVEWEAKLKTANTRIEEMEAERAVSRIKRDVAKETRKQTRGAKKQSLDDEAANLKDLIAQAWKKQKGGDSTIQPLMGLGKFDPEGEITKLVLQLVRNRVKANVGLKSEALVDQIHGLVKDITDLDKRQVRDMISGYGRTHGTRSELQKQIDALKTELFKLSSEEDIQAGTRSPRSEGPRKREQYGAKEGPRRSEANRLPMEGPRITDAPKLGPRDTAPELRKRLEAQIDVLQKKIDTGDFNKTERRGPIVYDRQTLAIQQRLETIKREYSKANYRATRGRFGMVTDELAKAANVPKTLKSMGDVSAMFRQGGFYAITHPVEGLAKPTRDMLRSFTEAGYRNVENAIKNDADFENSRRDGVEYTGVDKTDPNLSHREESYFGGETIDLLASGKYNPLRAVKGVKNFSERTFISFLDSQRLHMYKTMKEGLTDPGIIRRTLGQRAVTRATSPQDFKNIAKLINIGTGRGDIPKFLGGNKAAPVLNVGIFAPRLIASRVQLLNNMFNPVKMARMSPGSRNQMIADNVKFLAATAIVFKLAEAAGGTVNLDPDDADFLKIRFGNTTYDTLTGLQQPLRYIINMTRAATGGETYSGKDAGEMTKRFARSKVAPGLPAIGVDYLAGEDFEGRPFSLKRELVGSREKLYTDSQFSPLPAQDFAQAMQEEGLVKGFVKATPAVTGVGVQSYPERLDKPTTKAEKLAHKFVGENIPHKIRTEEQIETSRKMSDLKARSRKGEDVKQELANLEGQIRGKQAKAILGAVNKTRFQEDFNRLSPKQAAIVYSVATEAERAGVKDILERKSLAIADMTDAEQADMDRRLKALGMVPDTGPRRQRPQRPQEVQKAQRAQRSGYSFPN